MSETPLLRAEALCRSYRSGADTITVLGEVDLNVERGEMVAIVGASGSGKTTLLQILGTLDAPDSGALFFRERELTGLAETALAGHRNAHIGFIFQFHHLLPEFSALENVLMPGMIGGRPTEAMRAAAEQLLGRVGLGERLHHRSGQLSGGEQQRVALARALVMNPALLLADEPTGNLDSQMARSVMELLEDINQQGTTIIMVTHDPELAARAQRNVHIVDGMATDLSVAPGLARAAHAARAEAETAASA